MSRRLLVFVTAVLFSHGGALRAEDEVFLRGGEKPYKNAIKSESGRGVEIVGKKETIPAEEIVDILYQVTPIEVRLKSYRPTFQAERKYFDPTIKREPKEKITLTDLLKGYSDSLPLLKEPFARRHVEFKIAYFTTIIAQENGGDLGPAEQLLSSFKSKHSDSWQIASCLRMLASVQLAQKKLAEAQATFQELAAANVSPEAKLEGELMSIQIGVGAGKAKESLKKLDEILAKLPKGSRLTAKARIAKAMSLAAAKDTNQAGTLLRQIISDSADKSIKASAYNALGEIHFQAAAYKDALWEFLYVDVVYNQDKNEHAKALYYLGQVFDKLGEADRARECRELLIADRLFAGLEWQRLAIQATKAP